VVEKTVCEAVFTRFKKYLAESSYRIRIAWAFESRSQSLKD